MRARLQAEKQTFEQFLPGARGMRALSGLTARGIVDMVRLVESFYENIELLYCLYAISYCRIEIQIQSLSKEHK